MGNKFLKELKILARREVIKELEADFTKEGDFESLEKLKKIEAENVN